MTATTILGKNIGSGERVYMTLPVTTMASGYKLEIPVHILNGVKPGPKIFLNAVSHGDAYTGIRVIKQVLETADVNQLSGSIIAVPCANPIAFEWDSRNTPVDDNNLNRNFPGTPKGWLTDQIGAVVSSICPEADLLIDWHGGSYGTAIHYILMSWEGAMAAKKTELTEEIFRYAKAYGLEFLYSGKPAGDAYKYMGTLCNYMDSLDKPAFIAEIGSGMELPFDQVGQSVQGVFNVMKEMGMYPGKPIVPQVQYYIHERPLMRPKNGGLFIPVCGIEYLNKSVPKGTLMSQVISPLTLEVIEEMYAPCEETVFLNTRAYPTKVHPGDYAYILGNLATADRIYNE